MAFELAGTVEDLGNLFGRGRAGDVGTGVAETLEHGERLGGALEPRLQPAIGCVGLLAQNLDERGRYPGGHLLGGATAEDMYVPQQGDPQSAVVHVAFQFGEFPRIPPRAGDREIRPGRDLPFEPQILIEAVLARVAERRDGDRDVERRAFLRADLRDHLGQLHRIEVGRRVRAGPGVAGQGEHVEETEGAHLAERLAHRHAVAIDAGQMDVRLQPPRADGGADAQRILAGLAVGIARDTAGGHLGDVGEVGPDLEQLRFALRAGGDELDDGRERAGRDRLGELNHRGRSSRTSRVPSLMALSLRKATSRGRCTHPQSGLITSRSAGMTASARRMRSATMPADSTSCVLTSMTPRPRANGTLNSLNSRRSSSPRRANSSDTVWTFASRMRGKR